MIRLADVSSTGLTQLGRVAREPMVQTTAALMAAPVTVAGLHAVGVSTDLNTEQLGVGLIEARLWLTLSLVAGFGVDLVGQNVAMRVPRVALRVIDLRHAHALLGEPHGRQRSARHGAGAV